MQAIETEYNGYRFRSRAEARWAVFFDGAGIAYRYEPEGYDLDGEWYLPDFWLPGLNVWMEVKGGRPNDREVRLCQKLAEQSGRKCLIAMGEPQPENSLMLVFKDGSVDDGHEHYLAEDRRNTGELWLVSNDQYGWTISARPIGEHNGPEHDRLPLIHGAIRQGYLAARAARFEHGEKPQQYEGSVAV